MVMKRAIFITTTMEMNINRGFMKNLRELREIKKKTQIEMAIACGISLSTYRLIEYGAQKPNPDVLKKLENELGFK